MKSRAFQLGVACLAFLLTSAVQAKADVYLLIDDYAEDPIALHLLGPVLDSSIQVTQEGIGLLGTADAHFEYVSSTPLPIGASEAFNYNIYDDPAHTQLSDTWNLTFTGITPVRGDASNMSVDTAFRSDSLDGVAPPSLANGVAVTENQFLAPPSGLPDASYQYVASPLSDLTTGFNSAEPTVPEPGFFPLVAIGMVGMLAYRFRGRKQSTVNKG